MHSNYRPGDKVIFTGWPSDIIRPDLYACDMPETMACYCGDFDRMIGREFTIDSMYLCCATGAYATRDHYRYTFEDAPDGCSGCYFVEEWFQPSLPLPSVVVEDLL